MEAHEPVESKEYLESVKRMTKDIQESTLLLSKKEIQFLVDSYYRQQENRIRADAQVRELYKTETPHQILAWLASQSSILEREIKKTLDVYSNSSILGLWFRSIVGIGPVIASGLIAHIDPERAKTSAAVWRFAGVDPTSKWGKGQKRPWNAALKVLVWHMGESFVKVSGKEKDIYGKIYMARKGLEIVRNEAGELADQAVAKLKEFNIGKGTIAYSWYKKGMLPPAHIHSRATRYAAKLCLAHFHEAAYFIHFGMLPPMPYPVTHLDDHAHFYPPPNTDMIPGFTKALAKKI